MKGVMNIFDKYQSNGLSSKGLKKINKIVECIMQSFLSNEDRKELVDFMRDLERYLEGDD